MPHVRKDRLVREWVDFHYEVNGKVFDFSIPGGGYISLTDLVEVLGIAEIDGNTEDDEEIDTEQAAKKFVADVENVEFSSPELVSVRKVEENMTVGAIKDALGLVCEYSAELTEEEIAEIDGTGVEAGDWALISLKPFNTDEELIVTMRNKDQFIVRVTDAQQITSVSNIVEGEYVFYVGSGGSNYAIKYDGTTANLGSGTPSASASEDIIWMLHNNGDRTWTAYSKSHPENHLNFDGDDSTVIISASGSIVIQPYSRDSSGGFDFVNSNKDKFLSIDTTNRDKFVTVASGLQSRMRIYQVNAHSVEEDTGNKFTVTVSPAVGGTVTVGDGTASTSTKADIKVGGENQGKNDRQIKAAANSNYVFSHWELDGVRLEGDAFATNTIKGSTLSVSEGQTLTAVFNQKDTPDSPVNNGDAQAEINRWLQEILGNSAKANKTAAVSGDDYANRIYKVALDASSGARVMEQSVSLTFLVDTSRSMLFPADLGNDKTYTKTELKTWLDTYDPEGASGKTYYIIADEANTATMYAVYYRAGAWRYMDASYYYDSYTASINTSREGSVTDSSYGTVDNKSGGRALSGHIYTAPERVAGKPWTRLDYIKLALKAAGEAIAKLDPEPNIGLVTFNKAATYIGAYGASQYIAFQNAVDNDIELDGGTRQDLGLAKVIEKRSTLFPAGNGRRNVTLLITDGAPQIAIAGQNNKYEDNETAWGSKYIGGQVNLLTNTYGIELFTLGLSLDKVGVNEAKLNGIATDDHHWGANESSAYVTAIEEIAEEMMSDVTLFGSVTDTVDPAFYPVLQDGTPLEAGYYDMDGNHIGASQPSGNTPYYKWENNGGTWAITWNNQDIKWPANGGWSNSFFIKAKENYLGGNTVNTNLSAEINAKQYRDSNSVVKNLGRTVSVKPETPHVNIDELQLTYNDSSVTVNLGETVNSMQALQALYNDIEVSEVVNHSSEDHRIASEEDKNTAHDDNAEKFKLSTVAPMTNDLWIKLLKSVPSDDRSRSIDIPYTAYGHDSGTIRVSLKQVLKDSEPGVFYIDDETLPGEHVTSETGYAVEKYTLTATFIPEGEKDAVYHTTQDGERGDVTDNMESVNTHIVNVMAPHNPTPADKDGSLTYRKQIDYLGDGTDSDLTRNGSGNVSGTDAHKNNTSDTNDLYRLYLDATMKKIVSKANVIIVEDYSTSMNGNGGYTGMQQALLGANQDGLVYDLLGEEMDNQLMIIKFSDDRTHPRNGTNVNGSEVLVSWTDHITDDMIGKISADFPTADSVAWDNGDNSYWTDYTKALELIGNNLPNNDNPTYVVFMSDGVPTVYMENGSEVGGWEKRSGFPSWAHRWSVDGKTVPENLNVVIPATESYIRSWLNSHSDLNIVTVGYGEAAENRKISGINLQSSQINEALTVGNYDTNYLLKLLGKNGYYSAENADDLENAFASALELKPITAVEIRDTLSGYVEFYAKDPDITVTKSTKDGTRTAMELVPAAGKENSWLVYSSKTTHDDNTYVGELNWNPDTKEIKLTFAEFLKYRDGDAYLLAFNVEASTQAYEEYASNKRGGDPTGYNGQTGGEDTDYGSNHTSVSQPGFPSNADATVTYKYGDERRTMPYPDPVIQVGSTGLTLEKKWVDKDNHPISAPEGKESIQFKLYANIPGTDGSETIRKLVDTYTIHKGAGDKWILNVTNLDPKVLVNPGLATAEYQAITYTIEEVNLDAGYTAQVEFTRTESTKEGEDGQTVTDSTTFSNTTNRYEDNGKHIYYIPGQAAEEQPGRGTITNKYEPFDLTVKKNWNISDANTNTALANSKVKITIGRYILSDKAGTITITKTGVPSGADFAALYILRDASGKVHGTFSYAEVMGGVTVSLPEGTYSVTEEITRQDADIEWNHSPAPNNQGMSTISGISVTDESTGTAAFTCDPKIRTGSIKVVSSLTDGGSGIDFTGVRYTVYEADGLTRAKDADGAIIEPITYNDAKNGYTVSNLKVGSYVVIESNVPSTGTDYILKSHQPEGADSVTVPVEENKTTPVEFASVYEEKPKATIPVSIDIVNSSGTQYFSNNYGNFVPGSQIKVTVNSRNHADYSGEYWTNVDSAHRNIGYGDSGKYLDTTKEISLILTVPSTGSLQIHMKEPWGANSNLSVSRVDPYTEDVNTTSSRRLMPKRAQSAITPGTATPGPATLGANPTPADTTKKYTDDTTFSRTVELTQGKSWQEVISGLPLSDGQGHGYYYYIKNVTESGMPENTTVTVKLDGNNKYIVGSDIHSGGSLEVTNVVPETAKTEIKIIKVSKGDGAPYTPISGAKFTLTLVDEEGHKLTDEYYSGEQPVAADGELIFPDLRPGRYLLEETKVPDGYIKKEGPYYITIGADGSSSVEDGHSYTLIHELDDDEYTIENEPGLALPSTGGPGTIPFHILGIMLTGLAGAGLVMRRRRAA